MANSNLESEYKYFVKNRAKICSDHPEKYVVIKNQALIGIYDDQVTAFTETSKSEEPGTFLIQHCSKDTEQSQVFHSRVISF